jgi:hypothetical protein
MDSRRIIEGMTVMKSSSALSLFASIALCQGPRMLMVQGISGTSITVSASDLAKLTQQTINTDDHGNL